MRARQFFRLVGFECRKAFLNPAMLIFFVALLLFNGWKINDSYDRKVAEWTDYEAQYTETYGKYSGTITAEKISDLMTIYAPLEEKKNRHDLSYDYDPNAYTYSEGMDEKFYRTLFYTELKYDYLYQNEAYRIAENAMQMAAFYEGIGNDFEAAKNQQIAAEFSGRVIPAFSDTRGYEVLLNYDYSAMLVLLFSIFALCGVFVTERETDMYMLLRTTKNGTGSTVAAKLTAATLFVIVVCAVFFGQDFLSIYFASPRNTALKSTIYALRAFESTGLSMTIGQYFLWSAMAKTVGILACCTMILLVSSLFKQTLGAFFTSLALLLGSVALQEFCRGKLSLRWFNPMELVIGRELVYRDAFVDVFGLPVRLNIFMLTGVLLTVVIMICGILYLNRSYHKRVRRRDGNVTV